MPNQILHKRSSTPGAAPTAGQLAAGELALNLTDGKIFAKKADGTVAAFPAVVDGGIATTTATALTYYFTGVSDSDWGNPANWFLDTDGTYPANVVPGPDDDVVIRVSVDIGPQAQINGNNTGNYTVSVRNIHIGSGPEAYDENGWTIYANLEDSSGVARLVISGNLTCGNANVPVNGYSSDDYGNVYCALGLVDTNSTATFYYNGYFSTSNWPGVTGGKVIIEGGSVSYMYAESEVELRWGYLQYAEPAGNFKFLGGICEGNSFYSSYGFTTYGVEINPGTYDAATDDQLLNNYFYGGPVVIYYWPSDARWYSSSNYFTDQSWQDMPLNIQTYYANFDTEWVGEVNLTQKTGSSILFLNSTINYISITGNATFNDTSRNGSTGDVTGTATFTGSACNDGGAAGTFVPNPPPSC